MEEVVSELIQDVKTFLISLDKDDGTGYAPMDYRPMWEGEVLVGFEVFLYPI